MGFGTFFIGYFFLINATHYFFTDIIASFIMLMGAYKLSRFNKAFRWCFIFTFPFAAVATLGFALNTAQSFFDISAGAEILGWLGLARHLSVFGVTLFHTLGIVLVAKEVEANRLSLSAKILAPFSAVMLLSAFVEAPGALGLLGKAAVIAYALSIILYILVITANLFTIYKAYMQICMPEDLEPKKKGKPGIFAKFTAYEEKKSREYAEYKINRRIEKAKKRKSKKGRRK